MYTIIVSSEFKRGFDKLDKNLQERAKKILKRLKENPFGSPLKGDLNNFYSVHFERNHYRLIYLKKEDILTIIAIIVGRRTNDFYDKLHNIIKRFKDL